VIFVICLVWDMARQIRERPRKSDGRGEGVLPAAARLLGEPALWADGADPNRRGEPNEPNSVWVDGDHHLKSQAGRWDPACEGWVKDDVTSACIDAGDPNSPVGHEPFPNGGQINMGALGGTAEASKSYLGEPVCETVIAGDINGDCKVDFQDFRIMAVHWLHRDSEAPSENAVAPNPDRR
jgi:hypothetical protein